MKIYISLIAALFTSICIFSQERSNFQNFEGSISGKVIDELTKEPIPYANISVYRTKDSTLVGGGITNENGFFKIENLHPGMFKIKVDFMGYDRFVSTTRITPKNTSVSVGIIKLKPAVLQLGEVEVISDKPLVEFKLDKKVINVDKNIVTSGGNATDILRNTPSVQVDMDGNVLLRGSTNVNILIDGKPSSLVSNDNASILEQIPASTIERIEIITNPSAKYDPEGMAGILNIVTKREKRQGINGLVTLNYGTKMKYGGTFSINRKVNKTNLFFSYDYKNEDRNWYRDHDRYLYYNSSLFSHTTISSNKKNNFYSHNLKGGFDYDFNPRNSIIFTANYRVGERKSDEKSINKVITSDTISAYYDRNEASNYPSQNIDLSLGYKKKFDDPDRIFTTDIYYSLGIFNKEENYEQFNYIPIYLTPDQKANYDDKKSNFIIQSDYTHPLDEKTRLDAGLKAYVRTTDNNYFFYDYDTLISEFKKDTTLSNHFIYSDYIYAVYSTLSHEWKKFSLQAGLRAEETFQHGNQKTTGAVFDRNYFSMFPSFHLSYNLPKDNKLQISYSRRINRPNPRSINPFIDKSDPLTWRKGNPDLKPEYINSYELGHIKDWKKLSLTSQIFYKSTYNVISRYREVDTSGIITVYPLNMSKAESYGLEFTVSSQPAKFMRLMGMFSWFKTTVIGSDGENDLTNSIFSYDAKFNGYFFLSKNLSMQLNGIFYGPSVMAQATRKGFYAIDIGLKKEIWNRKASLSIRLTDVFDTMKFQIITDDPNLKASMKFKRDTQVLYVTFTYKINEGIKQKDRQRQQNINIDSNFDIEE